MLKTPATQQVLTRPVRNDEQVTRPVRNDETDIARLCDDAAAHGAPALVCLSSA